MAGLTMVGGYGLLNGLYGLAADNLLGAEVVLADGRCVMTGPDEEPELFWAIRGGGGKNGSDKHKQAVWAGSQYPADTR
jgi:FAD/FMN-containing dehydrogenase